MLFFIVSCSIKQSTTYIQGVIVLIKTRPQNCCTCIWFRNYFGSLHSKFDCQWNFAFHPSTVIVSDIKHIEMIGIALRNLRGGDRITKVPTENKQWPAAQHMKRQVNTIQQRTSWGAERTETPVKLVEVWFGFVIQVKKNWDEVMSRVANFIRTKAIPESSSSGGQFLHCFRLPPPHLIVIPGPNWCLTDWSAYSFVFCGRVEGIRYPNHRFC